LKQFRRFRLGLSDRRRQLYNCLLADVID